MKRRLDSTFLILMGVGILGLVEIMLNTAIGPIPGILAVVYVVVRIAFRYDIDWEPGNSESEPEKKVE